MTRRAILIPLVALLVVVACAAVYLIVLSRPAYRTAVLVDTSAPGTALPQIAGAVRSVVGNSGDSDAVSVRRFGGECGSPGATAEIADDPDQVAQAVDHLVPSGKATMVDGIMAAIDSFSGFLNRRGSVRNRIIVISTTGVDACTDDPAGARKSIDDRLAAAGLDLDIRVVGFQVPQDEKEALAKFASDTTFADTADDLKVVLDRLVVPDSPDAASLSVAPPEPEPSYAFLSTGRMGIVRGTKVIAETAVDRTTYGTLSLEYTADGHFVFAVTPTGITTLDVRSGAVRKVACGSCQEAVAAGGSVIRWLAGTVLTTLDLADENAQPVPGTSVLPGRNLDEFGVLPLRILAAKDGNTFVAAPDGVSAYGGPENLYLVRSGGEVVPLGAAEGNVAIFAAAFSPDGRTLMYVATGHAGACQERSSAVLINIATGAHSTTPPIGDPNDDGAGPSAIWYDEDGTLNMIYSSWLCSPTRGSKTMTVPESTWRLGNAGWTRQGDPGYVRQVAPGFRAVLVRPAEDSFTQQLFSEVDGTRTKILDDAVAIAVPN